MLKEALQYIVGLKPPTKHVDDESGKVFFDTNMHEVKTKLPHVEKAITVQSLASVIAYLNSDADQGYPNASSIVSIFSPTMVMVLSDLDEDGDRDLLLQAGWKRPEFPFGQFVAPEQFILEVHGHFARQKGDFEKLLDLVSSMTVNEETKYTDSGITQDVVTRRGINVGIEKIPNPFMLAPFRTFPEVEIGEAPFLLRAKQSGTVLQLALFEVDGGAWEVMARSAIKAFFDSHNIPADVVVLE